MLFRKKTENSGVKDGKLAPCPGSPNCVSSRSSSDKHYIVPFMFNSDPVKEMERLKSILASLKGVTIVDSSAHYLHAECRTPLMGFVDDLEFYWDEEKQVCQVRSASRTGYSDFGKNRSRVDEIRDIFERLSSDNS
ncbi:MAG: DUF1499 domain-containing protein [Candidatus Anammoxibacter sp.]